jgi:hypothetical protein
MILDQLCFNIKGIHNKQTQPILYVQVCQVLEWVKFEHNNLCRESKNLGSDYQLLHEYSARLDY